jgi:hypothetical protein
MTTIESAGNVRPVAGSDGLTESAGGLQTGASPFCFLSIRAPWWYKYTVPLLTVVKKVELCPLLTGLAGIVRVPVSVVLRTSQVITNVFGVRFTTSKVFPHTYFSLRESGVSTRETVGD